MHGDVIEVLRESLGLADHAHVPGVKLDDPAVAASILDGLSYGSGDAVIGVNPATDNVGTVEALLRMLDRIRECYRIPTQTCVLAHVTTQMQALERGAPVDLIFQSIAGTEAANSSFGINLALLDEASQAARELKRPGKSEAQVMYFETGQGSALSANAHLGVDQQTCEARAYAVARRYQPLLVNSVVGGPVIGKPSRMKARTQSPISAGVTRPVRTPVWPPIGERTRRADRRASATSSGH